MADDASPSLRETLSAAFDADEASQTVAPAAESAPVVEAPAVEAQPAPAPQSSASETGAPGAPTRDENGRFAKSTDLVQNAQITEEEPAEASAIRPPASWKVAAKAAFSSLPLAIQEEVHRRESEMLAGLAQHETKLAYYNRFSELVAPHREKWQLNGVDEFQAIQQLLAASDLLDRDPDAGLRFLAQRYGRNLQQYAQPAQQQAVAPNGYAQPVQPGFAPQGLQDPQLAPALQPLLQKLQNLEQSFASQQESAERAEQARFTRQIEEFANDPKHPYFHNVVERMTALLSSGQASDLGDAYEQACWADKEIRALQLAEQSKAQTTANNAQRAQAAAVQVTGSPGAATGAVNGAQPASTRAALLDAWDQAEGRA